MSYAKKDFSRAVLEFGEGLKNYPESIKGPDNMLKLGLSFSNLNKKTEACNVLIELSLYHIFYAEPIGHVVAFALRRSYSASS